MWDMSASWPSASERSLFESSEMQLVDLTDGQIRSWTAREAGKLFPNYQPEWGLSVGTRGNGMAWLLDPAIERSDLDACAIDHEDWIFPYLERPAGCVCLDLASFVGTNAIWWAKRGVAVVACEPVPMTCDLLEKNIALNEVTDSVEVIRAAFGAAEGKARMSVNSYNSHFATAGELMVNVTTLDREFRTRHRLDLIKLDVEGAECEVIAGGLTTLRRLRPRLVIEVHSHMPGRESNGNILANQLRELNYSFRRIWENSDAYFYVEAIPN